MDSLRVCRLCLSVGARMCVIADTPLQEHYEKVTNRPLISGDGKPIMACYICHHLLRKSQSFFERTVVAEDLLQQIVDSGLQLTEASIVLINSAHLKTSLGYHVALTEEFHKSIDEDAVKTEVEKVEIKIEREDLEETDEASLEETDTRTGWPESMNLPVKRELIEKGTYNDEAVPDSKGDIPLMPQDNQPPDAACGSGRRHQPQTSRGELGLRRSNILRSSISGGTVKTDMLVTVMKTEPLPSESTKTVNHEVISVKDKCTSLDKKTYLCNYCNRRFNKKSNLTVHIRTHTGETPYRCSSCDKSFAQKSNLTKHIRSHTGEKPYRCNHCNKAFVKKNHLTDHIRTHTGETPYRCKYCQKSFSRSSCLTRHIKSHTGEKSYRCIHCEKAFCDKSNLTKHVRSHTGEKPYRCSQCEKSFCVKSNLTDHIRSHTGEKPYRCSHCVKTFSVQSNLITHIRTHTGQKPYRCNDCNKSFSLKGHLTSHVRLHTGELPYPCSQCERAFSRRNNLTAHVKRLHGETPLRFE